MKVLILIYRLGRGGAQRLVLDICEVLNKRNDVEYKLVVFDTMDLYPEYRETVPRTLCNSWVDLSISGPNKIDISELQGIMDEFEPDVIHSHLFIPEIISRACYYPRAAWFTHMHDNMSSLKRPNLSIIFNKELLTNYYERRFVLNGYKRNGGNNFVAISEDAYNFTRDNLKDFDVTLLPNAINTKKIGESLQTDVSHRTNTLKLINIGSFQPKKNQQLLVKIGALLKQKNVDFEMHLLGDGLDRSRIEDLTAQLGVNEHFHFHGITEHPENYLSASDIYVHSATYEPFGLVLVEAMAAGLPVITLDGKGNRELIDEGKNGFMISEQNPDLFVEKILLLSDDEALYRKMSENALFFSKKYDIEPYVDRLLDLYREKLQEGTIRN